MNNLSLLDLGRSERIEAFRAPAESILEQLNREESQGIPLESDDSGAFGLEKSLTERYSNQINQVIAIAGESERTCSRQYTRRFNEVLEQLYPQECEEKDKLKQFISDLIDEQNDKNDVFVKRLNEDLRTHKSNPRAIVAFLEARPSLFTPEVQDCLLHNKFPDFAEAYPGGPWEYVKAVLDKPALAEKIKLNPRIQEQLFRNCLYDIEGMDEKTKIRMVRRIIDKTFDGRCPQHVQDRACKDIRSKGKNGTGKLSKKPMAELFLARVGKYHLAPEARKLMEELGVDMAA